MYDTTIKFSANQINKKNIQPTKWFCWTDPIGTMIPKVPTKSKFDHVDGVFGQNIVLSCETQGHPVPVFR